MSLYPHGSVDQIKLLTPEEVIVHLKREVFSLKDFKFSRNFIDLHEIWSQASAGTNHQDVSDLSVIDGVLCYPDAKVNFIAPIDSQALKLALEHPKNAPAIAKAEDRLDADLAARGQSQQEIESLKGSLCQKIARLNDLHNPPPPPNYVEVLIYVPGCGTQDDIITRDIPMKGNMSDLRLLGASVQLALAPAGCPPGTLAELEPRPDEPWKYHLLAVRDKKVTHGGSVSIESEQDYQKMLKIVTKEDEAPRAIFTKSSWAITPPMPIRTTQKASEIKREYPPSPGNAFDEDGKPFFDDDGGPISSEFWEKWLEKQPPMMWPGENVGEYTGEDE